MAALDREGAACAGDLDPQDPRASPLHAEFHGAPPVWLCVSDSEFLRDDTLFLAERLTAQGDDVTLEVGRDLPHVWPMFHNVLPEARQTIGALGRWLRSRVHPSGDS